MSTNSIPRDIPRNGGGLVRESPQDPLNSSLGMMEKFAQIFFIPRLGALKMEHASKKISDSTDVGMKIFLIYTHPLSLSLGKPAFKTNYHYKKIDYNYPPLNWVPSKIEWDLTNRPLSKLGPVADFLDG